MNRAVILCVALCALTSEVHAQPEVNAQGIANDQSYPLLVNGYEGIWFPSDMAQDLAISLEELSTLRVNIERRVDQILLMEHQTQLLEVDLESTRESNRQLSSTNSSLREENEDLRSALTTYMIVAIVCVVISVTLALVTINA